MPRTAANPLAILAALALSALLPAAVLASGSTPAEAPQAVAPAPEQKIMASADLIIPGHGPAIRVTADLVRHLIETFPQAPQAALCPEVVEQLQARLEKFAGCGSA